MKDNKELINELKGILGFAPPIDNTLSVATGKLQIDIIKLDKMVDEHNKDYDSKECIYKGKEASMRNAIEEIYGNRAVEIIENLL